MDDVTSSEWLETTAEAMQTAFRDALDQIGGRFGAREQVALRLANEVVRQWTANELERIASRYGDEVLVSGQRYRRHSSGVRRYHSLCGAVAVRRHLYRQVGVHNGPTVVPLEIEAGLLENATPALAVSVSQAFASMPLRHYQAEMQAAHRVVPSRSTLERICKRVGARIHDELPAIEPILRAGVRLPPGAHAISVGLDRTTIPMEEPCSGRRQRRGKPYVRRPPPAVTVAYRMAYVATIALHDDHGDTLQSRRFAATAQEGPRELLARFAAELGDLRALAPSLPITIIQDGAPELWTLVEECLAALNIPVAHRLIDRYHVDERLAACAETLQKGTARSRRLLRRWRRELDRDPAAIYRIGRYLDRALHGPRRAVDSFWPIACGRGRTFDRTVVEAACTYFRNAAHRMNYAEARRRGLPVGSGVTEGACKSVVAARFKRSGQRWHESGASPCLLLRTLHLDERLLPALQLHRDRMEQRFAC